MKESILEIHKEETKGFSKKPKKIVNKAKRLDALFIAGMLAWPIIHWFIFTGYGDVMMIVKSFQENQNPLLVPGILRRKAEYFLFA